MDEKVNFEPWTFDCFVCLLLARTSQFCISPTVGAFIDIKLYISGISFSFGNKSKLIEKFIMQIMFDPTFLKLSLFFCIGYWSRVAAD